jgi:hypothetical protein
MRGLLFGAFQFSRFTRAHGGCDFSDLPNESPAAFRGRRGLSPASRVRQAAGGASTWIANACAPDDPKTEL